MSDHKVEGLKLLITYDVPKGSDNFTRIKAEIIKKFSEFNISSLDFKVIRDSNSANRVFLQANTEDNQNTLNLLVHYASQ